jgi:uncharacterized repeat protein (TIGR01451 family)
VKIDGACPWGTNRLYFPDGTQTRSFRTAASLSLCPVLGDGAAGWTTTMTGWGLNQGAPSVAANSITVGGNTTTHAAATIINDGIMPSMPVTVTPARPNGTANVVVVDSVNTNTWPGAAGVRRRIALTCVNGPGSAGERCMISGTGFTAGTNIPANTITFNGAAVTHRAVYIGANGTFSTTVMDLPALNAGAYDVNAQEIFPAAYHVVNPQMAVAKYRDPVRGKAGDIVTFSFSFTNTDYLKVGDAPAVNFILRDTLPPLTQYVALSSTCYPSAKAEWFNGGTSTWQVTEPAAANVQAVRWTIPKVSAAASGWARFQVQIQ